ncbi:het-domain-containing protein, partial [Alternaria burnsii]
MMRTSSFEATDPRDRMFALVGLMEDIDESFVDYSKSYQDLTQELSRMFLNGTIGSTVGSELDVLSLISRDEKHEFTEPSWVVYFRSRRSFQHVPLVWVYPSKKPVVNRNPDIQFTNGEGDDSLHIRGTVFDVITHVVPVPVITENYLNTPRGGSESIKDIIAYQDWFQRVGDLIAPEGNLTTPPIGAGSHPTYKPTGESLYNAFWRTLCCNGTFTDSLNPPTDDGSFAKWLTFM